MGKRSYRLICKLGLGVFLGVLCSPLLLLYLFQGVGAELDGDISRLAFQNTFYLGLGVLFISTVLGVSFAYSHCFYNYPLKRTLHALTLMPLAFPAYVLGFIYLGLCGPSSQWSELITIQGELAFLIFVLTLALTPYVYYFCFLGFRTLSQNEWETEKLLGGGGVKFMLLNWGPKVLPFLLSAQILVLFEALSDFGAASVVNVPVVTTLIYKLWFDLFSFEGAVQLALKYSLIIGVLLAVEWVLKIRSPEKNSFSKSPMRGEGLSVEKEMLVMGTRLLFVLLAFAIPAIQVVLWSFEVKEWSLWRETLVSSGLTLGVALGAGILVVIFSFVLHFLLKEGKQNPKLWMLGSTIGYSIPGSLLAVSIYALLLKGFGQTSETILLSALVIGLAYKFLTVGMRPIGDRFECLSQDHFEVGKILNVSFLKKWRFFVFPYLRETSLIALLLVVIETMKEMPLTLMLAPGNFQTLSIKIFNFTSEGEWEKAALPSLLLLILGVISVSTMNWRGEH